MRSPQIGIYYQSTESIIHVKKGGIADLVTYGKKRVFSSEFKLLPIEYGKFQMLWCQQGDVLRAQDGKQREVVFQVDAVAREEATGRIMIAVTTRTVGGKPNKKEGWMPMDRMLPTEYVTNVRRVGWEERGAIKKKQKELDSYSF